MPTCALAAPAGCQCQQLLVHIERHTSYGLHTSKRCSTCWDVFDKDLDRAVTVADVERNITLCNAEAFHCLDEISIITNSTALKNLELHNIASGEILICIRLPRHWRKSGSLRLVFFVVVVVKSSEPNALVITTVQKHASQMHICTHSVRGSNQAHKMATQPR